MHNSIGIISCEKLCLELPLGGSFISRGIQRIISVNYLFGRPLIPSDFLERIVTSNFRDMRNLMSVVFGLLKMSFWVPKNGQLLFSEKVTRPKVFGK